MHRTVVAALVAALALGLAGCGSGERTATISRAQLVQRLKVACRAGNDAGKREMRRTGPLTSMTPLELFLAQHASLRTIIRRIGRLKASGTAGAQLEEYKRTIRTRLVALGKVAAADKSDRQRILREEIPAIQNAASRAHDLVVEISEQLRLKCF